jgi:YggT family protein
MAEGFRLLALLLSVYNILIIIRIVLQWLSFSSYSSFRSDIENLLATIVDPYLNLFKGLKFLRRGKVDFTPIAALTVVSIAQRVFQAFAYTRKFTFGYFLANLVQALWSSIGSLILGIIIILLAIRLFLSYRRSPSSIAYISILDSFLRTPLDYLHKVIFRGKEVSDRTLMYSALGASIAFYIICSVLVSFLISFLGSLPF